MTSTISCNPFPGLRPFRTDEDYLFFGREGQSEEILRRLRLNRFVAVVGTSGSGKSSLVRAGLLPYLFGGFMSRAGSHWRVAIFRPASDPIGNLARALNDPAVIGDAAADEEESKRKSVLLEVALRRSGLGLIEALRLSPLSQRDNLLIVVDQFEELFRFSGAASSTRKEEDAAAFVKLLLEAARQTELPVYVAITMRSDFIGDCARFRDLPEAVTAGLYLIPRMTREQRRAAIEGPVQVGSAAISRRLVNRLLNDGGDDPDQLPSLQHALMRAWAYWETRRRDQEPIDVEDYLAIGGMANALSQHAEEAFAELPDERSRGIAKRLFQSLTEKGPDNREVRRPTKLADIAAMADAQIPEVIAVIEYFRREGRSFLMPPSDVALDSESVIDISHESLIRGWDRLKTWVEEEYESAKMYRRLAETAALHAEEKAALWHDPDLANALRWKSVEKPTAAWARCYSPGFEEAMAFLEHSRRARDQAAAEREIARRKRLRNARWYAATVSALFLIAGTAAIYAFREQGRAVENARQAQKQRDVAQLARKQAEDNQKIADRNQAVAVSNQDMALGFASSTVRGLSELNDFVLNQREVQEQFESLLKEAGTVHQSVLSREHNNFQAMVMRVNAQTALAKLHFYSGRVEAAKRECAEQEKEAAELEKTDADYSSQLLGAYLLSRIGYTRTAFNDDPKQALADVRHAVQVTDRACSGLDRKQAPLEPQVLRCMNAVYATSAFVEQDYGDPKAALQNYRKAVNILTTQEHEAATAHGRQHLDSRLREFLIVDMRALAALEAKTDPKASAATYSKAIQLARSWDEKDDSVTSALLWLYTERGDSERDARQYAAANRDYQAAAELARSLNPNTRKAQYDSASVDERLGSLDHYQADIEQNADRKRQQLESARKRHEMALQKFQATEEKAKGKNPGLEHSIGIEEHNLAWDYAALQDAAEARKHYERSRDAYKLAADVNRDDDYLKSTAMAYRTLAGLDEQKKDWNGAIENYGNAIEFDKRIVRLDAGAKHLLLSDYEKMADARVQNGDPDAALEAYKNGMETGESWTEETTVPLPVIVKDVVALHLGRGDIWLQKKDYEKARGEYDAAERHAGHLSSDSVDGKFARSQVWEHRGKAWTTQAGAEPNAARKRELYLQAKNSYENSLQLDHQISDAAESAITDNNVAFVEDKLAWNSYSLNDWEGARQHFTACADAYNKALRLRHGEQERNGLEKAYVYLMLVDVDRGKDLMSKGKEVEGEAAFKSARAAAARPEGWASFDERRVRSVVEEYIADYWRAKRAAAKDRNLREAHSRRALEGDENALKLWRAVGSGKKDPDVEQHVAKAEKDLGLDYAYLNDWENAKRHYEASSQIYLTAKPGNETVRIVAANYDELAREEIALENRRAACDAYGKVIQLLKPLVENLHATAADKTLLANAFGVRSWENSLLGDPWAALSDADQGLALDSRQIFIRLNKADAYLLLGQSEKAREIYFAAASDPGCKGCRDAILGDLTEIQSHPELKVDPNVLARLQDELKRIEIQATTRSESADRKQ